MIQIKPMGAWFGVLAVVVLAACAQSPQRVEGAAGGPRYAVDATLPKPLPNNWILGQVAGIATDRDDNIWLIHRPLSLTEDERGATLSPPRSKCCAAAPAVLQFDRAGNLLRSWGGKGQGYDWGQLSMLFDTVPSAISQVRAGALRAIAVTAPARLPAMPELPTVAETLPGFEVAVWGGIYAPAGTPEKWIEALDREIQAVLKDPTVAQRFEQLGFAPLALGPKDFAAFTRAEIAKWGEVIRIGKITAD